MQKQMSKPKQESRKEEILRVFERLVSRFGLDKVTMQDIAREVGISVGTIYLDYENKEALIEAIEDSWRVGIENYNDSVVAGSLSPEKKLHKLIVEHIKHFSVEVRENQAMFELLMGTMHIKYIRRRVSNKQQEIFDSMSASVKKILKEGRDKKVFAVKDLEMTSQLFVQAFAEFFLAPRLVIKDHDEVVKGSEGMFQLLMRAIREV